MITISGYANDEKDNIGNFCKLLGAFVQQSLSLKDQQSGIRANTHLISKLMTGPKYSAAKSWKKPIVTPEWLVDCCITGIKADEAKYFIENQYSYKDLMENVAKVRKNEENLTNSSYGGGTNPSSNKAAVETTNDSCLAEYLNSSKNVFDERPKEKLVQKKLSETLQNEETINENEPANKNDLSLSFHNESKKPRLDESNGKTMGTF